MSISGPLAQMGEAYANVEVYSADGSHSLPFRAKVDTGAYASLLDKASISELGLEPVDVVTLNTAAGPVPSQKYMARVVAAPIWDGRIVIVAGRPGTDQMLLGRQWLSKFRFEYDGPGRRFSISRPP